MTTSSLSITIKWANSKLAEALRQQEEDELTRPSGRTAREEKSLDENGPAPRRAKVSSANRWTSKATWSAPSPLTERPRSEGGATTFHFAVTTVSKHGSPTFDGKPVTGFGAKSSSPGADHEAYIGREGAPEVHSAAHAAYIERESAVEIDPDFLERDPVGAYADEVGEDFDEALLAKNSAGVASIFSNISHDPEERAEYWRAVHNAEREARVHQLVIDASKDADWIWTCNGFAPVT